MLGHPVTLDPETLQATLDPARIVAGRTAPGGSAPAQVRDHANTLIHRSAEAGRWRDAHRRHNHDSEQDLIAQARKLAVNGPR
jgi:hypothetical protein